MNDQAATTMAPNLPNRLPTGPNAFSSLAVAVLNEHVNDGDLCAVRGSVRPRERVILADHNYDLVAS